MEIQIEKSESVGNVKFEIKVKFEAERKQIVVELSLCIDAPCLAVFMYRRSRACEKWMPCIGSLRRLPFFMYRRM